MSAFKRDAVQPQTVTTDAKRDLAWRQNGRDMVAAEIEQMLTRRGSKGLPEAIPKTIRSGAAWILDVMIDPPADDETIRRVPAFNGFTWQTPYRDRAVYLAAKFLHLPEADQEQVCAYVKSGIRWRGDSIEFLALLAATRAKRDAQANADVGREALRWVANRRGVGA